MPKTKKEIFKFIIRILKIIIGSFLLGLGNGLFMIPYSIIAGGVSGIGIIIGKLCSISDITLMITLINVAFFILGWILLGHSFALKTVISTIIYPVAIIIGTALYNAGLNFGVVEEIANDSMYYLLAAVFGGIFIGAGVALTFSGGGSTGGVDVITLVINKYTGIKASRLSFFVDAVIILLGLIVNPFDKLLVGIISTFTTSIIIDKLFDSEKNVVANVISSKYDEINNFVADKLDRTTTIISAVGGYSSNEVKLLQIVLNYQEYYILEDIIAKVDPQAFVYITKAYSVKGEGFKAHVYRNRRKNKNEGK